MKRKDGSTKKVVVLRSDSLKKSVNERIYFTGFRHHEAASPDGDHANSCCIDTESDESNFAVSVSSLFETEAGSKAKREHP